MLLDIPYENGFTVWFMAGDDNKLSLNTDSSLLFMARIHNNKLNLYFFWVETVNLLVLTQNQFPIKKNSEPILHKQRPSRLPAPPWPTSRESSDLCRGGLIRREKTEVQVGEQFCQRREKTEYKIKLNWFDDVAWYCSSLPFFGVV